MTYANSILASYGQPQLARPAGEVVYVQPYSPAVYTAYGIAGIVGGATGAYHGYKRGHNSTGSAVLWGVLGTFFPIFTIPISLAQGYAEPAK